MPDFAAIAKAAATVAAREGLPDGWLNSAAAGFTYNFIKPPGRNLWKRFSGLHVYTASLDYLLVTKLMAHRSKDDADITALAKKLQIFTRREAIELLEAYMLKSDIPIEVLEEIEDRFAP